MMYPKFGKEIERDGQEEFQGDQQAGCQEGI